MSLEVFNDLGKRTLLMGILNCTPDSFSDGGQFDSPKDALTHALRLIEEGADILDIGGESTRPGATPVSQKEELDRVLPVIEAVRSADSQICISIDSMKSEVAKAALDSGADFVNDVSAMTFDDKMAKVVSAVNCPVVLMHMTDTPQSMKEDTHYDDVVLEVLEYLSERVEFAIESGIPRENLIVDPGLGFGKGPAHNAELLRKLGELRFMGLPILIGPSRKLFVESQKAREKKFRTRVEETIAASVIGAANGASIIRVHDVAPVKNALAVAEAIF